MDKLFIYNEIGEYGITANDFVRDLSGVQGDLELHINSPGGSVFDGYTIYNAIKQREGKTNIYIDGLAASIASVIAMAGDKIIMAENAMLMIHKASNVVWGNADEMKKEAATLDKIDSQLVGIYKAKTNLEDAEIETMLAEETWLTAQEALDKGFIDSIDANVSKAVAMFDLGKFGFKNRGNKMKIKNEVKPEEEKPTEPVEEVKPEEVEPATEPEPEPVEPEPVEDEKKFSEEEVQEMIENALKEEADRQDAIREIAFDGQEKLIDSLIKDKKSIDEARAEILADLKQNPPQAKSNDNPATAILKDLENAAPEALVPSDEPSQNVLQQWKAISDPMEKGKFFNKNKKEIKALLKQQEA